MNTQYQAVIVANGKFPEHAVPLSLLQQASHVICCDGAVERVHDMGLDIEAIIGDGDSISAEMKERYRSILHVYDEQENNDLTKAVNWALAHSYTSIAIVGATGKREDHCLGNISLLLNYARKCKVNIFTDYGWFSAIYTSHTFTSFVRQQVSVFNLTPQTPLTVYGLKYPIHNRCLRQWWEGSLNESEGDSFRLEFQEGEMLVFQTYDPK
ncbi:MAG: thiamine diphosphokinase [Bacteroidales bacterium]|nr:thiamine diphosphokinase [Bacteroidales bacterium]